MYSKAIHALKINVQIFSITCDKTEGHSQLWRNLRDKVASETAGVKSGVLHEEEHRIWHLHQLAVTQI